MENKKVNVLIDENKISQRISEVGAEIAKNYEGKNLYILSLLRGSFIFAADLVRAIDAKMKIGFMTTSSYGNAEETSGQVKIVHDVTDDLKDFDVLIVDDIVDSGITMDFVKRHIQSLGAKSVNTCVLLDKPSRRKVDIHPDFCCFEIEDVFVAGYGLNYGDFYRNVPYIFNWE